MSPDSIGSALLSVARLPSPVRKLKRRILLVSAMALLVGSGCNRDPIFREMSDSTYVRTMVALRKLPLGVDSVSRARQRDSVLRAFGVTAQQLETIAIRLSDDPARAAVVFRAIENPTLSSPP